MANQTQQLASLLSNWGSVAGAYTTAMNSAASATEENAKYMESLEAKGKAVQQVLEDLGNRVVGNELVGAFYDFAKGALSALNNGLGATAIQIGAITTLLWSGSGLIQAMKILPTLLSKGMSGASGASGLLTFLISGKGLLIIAGVTTAVVALIKLVDHLKDVGYLQSLDELNDSIDATNEKLETNKKRLEEINKIPWYGRTPEIIQEKEALEAENEVLEKQIENYKKKKQAAAEDRLSGNVILGTSDYGFEGAYESNLGIYSMGAEDFFVQATEKLREYQKILRENGKLTDEQQAEYSMLVQKLQPYIDAIETLGIDSDIVSDAARGMYEAYQLLDEEYQKQANYLNNEIERLRQLGIQAGLTGDDLINYIVDGINAINKTSIKTSDKIDALSALGDAAVEAYHKVWLASYMASHAKRAAVDPKKVQANAESQWNLAMSRSSYSTSYINKKTSGGNGEEETPPSGTGEDTKLESLKSQVSLLESEYSLLEAQGASSDKLIAKDKQIQEALHAQAEYMRKAGYAQEDINALSTKWWTIQKQINEELKEAVQAQIDYNQELVETYESLFGYITDEIDKEIAKLQEAYDLESDRLELLEKEQALEDAKNKRNIRVYNKETGQFEWVANQGDIDTAQKALDEYNRQQELDMQIEQLESQKKYIEDAVTQVSLDKKLDEIAEKLGVSFDNGWESLYDNIDDYLKAYKKAFGNVEDYTDELEKIGKAQADVDYSALWLQAKAAGADQQTLNDIHRKKVEQMAALGYDESYYDPSTGTWNVPTTTQQQSSTTQQQTQQQTTTTTTTPSGGGSSGSSGGSGGGGSSSSSSDIDYSALWWEAYDSGASKEELDAIHDAKVAQMEGSGKTYDPASGKWYASGTTYASGGISLVGEDGPEMRVLNQGDGIIPADITKNLWSFGKDPASYIKNIGASMGIGAQYNFGNISLSENQAKSMTVYQLAQLSRSLGVKNAV